MVCVSFMKYWFEKNYTIKQPAFDSATQSRTQLSHKALYFEWRCGCNHTLASELYLCSNPMQTPLIECNKFPPEAISSSAKITWNYHLSNSWQSMWRECELTKNSKLQRFITKQYFENHKLIISNNVMSIWACTPTTPPTHLKLHLRGCSLDHSLSSSQLMKHYLFVLLLVHAFSSISNSKAISQ